MPATERMPLPTPACPLHSFCCMCQVRRPGGRGGGEFVAIRGSWYGIERDRVFCLLGPNGAGKTTSINCLTGAPGCACRCAAWLGPGLFNRQPSTAQTALTLRILPTPAGVLPPSGGDALVYGESLSTPGGMDRIRWGAAGALPLDQLAACPVQGVVDFLPGVRASCSRLTAVLSSAAARRRSLMGVCPQFDVLWPELSGREHLQLYGRIKVGRACRGQ